MQNDTTKKTVLITGSSSGMGRLAVLKFARDGYITYASSREPNSEVSKEFISIAQKEHLTIYPIFLDLLDYPSIEKAVEEIIKETGKIDVLINNAGYGYLAAIEDIDTKEFSKQFETNVVGVLKTIQAVIPHMREQGKGLIINVSSIMGFSTAPLNGPYSSSKYALECLSETLATEVKPFGIKVVIVQPGGFHTKFLDNAVRKQYAQDSPYLKLYARQDSKRKMGTETGDPSVVADLLLKISKRENPKLRYMIGKEVLPRKILHTLLPGNLWVKFLRFYYKW